MENLNRVTINGMNHVYASLGKLEYIDVLHLSFRHWWTPNGNITSLDPALAKLKSLKEFSFELSDSWFLKDEETT